MEQPHGRSGYSAYSKRFQKPPGQSMENLYANCEPRMQLNPVLVSEPRTDLRSTSRKKSSQVKSSQVVFNHSSEAPLINVLISYS